MARSKRTFRGAPSSNGLPTVESVVATVRAVWGTRDSICQFYESRRAKKSTGKSRGIFVAVKTLVGQGGGTIGVTDTGRKLTEYILDAVQDQPVDQ